MRRESLSSDETAGAFREVMAGDGAPALVAGLLVALRVKGETAAELAGAARAMREAMTPLRAAAPDALVDTCGTGGGSVATFNISTASAIVAAGAGLRVAKHGNRSFTTRSGSADVLEALGVAIDITPDQMADVLHDAGIVFMFAPTMHPAMRHVGPVRRELGLETIMNMVGPLANPAGAGRQVVGVADPARAELMAGALAELGTVHSLVVHGEPGMDEISPLGTTLVTEVRNGTTTTWTVDPAALGVRGVDAAALAGGSPEDNARVVESVLRGTATPAAEAAVLLNAAAALVVGGKAADIASGMAGAKEAIASGAAMASLESLRRASRRAKGQ
jgi:anthranilate phosphoribosyltransferase